MIHDIFAVFERYEYTYMFESLFILCYHVNWFVKNWEYKSHEKQDLNDLYKKKLTIYHSLQLIITLEI